MDTMNSLHSGISSDIEFDLLQDSLHTPQFLEHFELDYPSVDHPRIEAAIKSVLVAVGEDVEQEGLRHTPKRVARAYDELLSGYRTDPAALLNNALLDVDYNDMVVVRTSNSLAHANITCCHF